MQFCIPLYTIYLNIYSYIYIYMYMDFVLRQQQSWKWTRVPWKMSQKGHGSLACLLEWVRAAYFTTNLKLWHNFRSKSDMWAASPSQNYSILILEKRYHILVDICIYADTVHICTYMNAAHTWSYLSCKLSVHVYMHVSLLFIYVMPMYHLYCNAAQCRIVPLYVCACISIYIDIYVYSYVHVHVYVYVYQLVNVYAVCWIWISIPIRIIHSR